MDGRPLIARRCAPLLLAAATLLAFAAPALAQWNAANGITISNAAKAQSNSAMVSDGAGGCFVAWYDTRTGLGANIYVRHVTAGGFTTSEIALTSDNGALSAPVAVADGSDGVIVSWVHAPGYVVAQRLDAVDAVQWSAGGVRVTTDNHSQLRPAIASDGAGGAIVAWEDYRGLTTAIFAQQLATASGARGWGAAAVNMDTSVTDDRLQPRIAADGAGGAVVCWDDSAANYHTTVRRILTGGAVTWPAPVVVGGSNERKAMLACDGAANTFVVWNRSTGGGSSTGAWATKLDANGATTQAAQRIDGTNGALAPYGVWPSPSGGMLTLLSDLSGIVHAQELTAAGAVVAAGGLSFQPSGASTLTGVAGAPDGVGGLYAAWTMSDNQAYGRHVISVASATRLPTPATTLTTSGATTARLQPSATLLTTGDFAVVWSDVASTDTNLVAQDFSPSGTLGSFHRVVTQHNAGSIAADVSTPTDNLNGTYFVADGANLELLLRGGGGTSHLDSVIVHATTSLGPVPNFTFSNVTHDDALRTVVTSSTLRDSIVSTPGDYIPLAFPLAHTDNTVATNFTARFGATGAQSWRLGRWNATANSGVGAYDEPPTNLTSIVPGQGYWFGALKTDTLVLVGNRVPESDFPLALQPAALADSGWNQIANPFPFPVVVADLEVKAGGGSPAAFTGNALTEDMVWSAPVHGVADTISVLAPWSAYWLWKKPGTANVSLVFPFAWDQSALGSAPSPAPAGAWSIAVTASAGREAANVVIGAATGAGPARALTHHAPPLSIAGSLSLGALEGGALYAREYRDDAAHLAWTLRVAGAGTLAEARLSFAFRGLPSGRVVTLSDPAAGWSRTVADGEAVTLALGADARDLVLAVAGSGGEAPAASGPAARLRAAAPNPFHDGVALSFWLPAGGRFGYDVFDPAGRRIARDERTSLAAGEHVLAWSGRDAAGVRVAPGVYLVRWRAAERSGVTRVVAVP